jgi:hypothetical protein
LPLVLTHGPTQALIRDPKEAANFLIDVKRFGRVIRNETEPGPRSLNICPTAEDVYRLCPTGSTVAVDIETAPANPKESWTGKDPTRAHMKSIAFGNETDALAIWWGNVDEGSPLWTAVRDVLADYSITKVFQNGFFFDLPVIRRYGLEVK